MTDSNQQKYEHEIRLNAWEDLETECLAYWIVGDKTRYQHCRDLVARCNQEGKDREQVSDALEKWVRSISKLPENNNDFFGDRISWDRIADFLLGDLNADQCEVVLEDFQEALGSGADFIRSFIYHQQGHLRIAQSEAHKARIEKRISMLEDVCRSLAIALKKVNSIEPNWLD